MSTAETFSARKPSLFAYIKFAGAVVLVAAIVAINVAAFLNRFLPLPASLALTSAPAAIIPALLLRREWRRETERRAERLVVDDQRIEWIDGEGGFSRVFERDQVSRITLDPNGVLCFYDTASQWTFELPTRTLENGQALVDRIRTWRPVENLRLVPFDLPRQLGRFGAAVIFSLLGCFAVTFGKGPEAWPLPLFALSALAWVSREPWSYRHDQPVARRILWAAAIVAAVLVTAIIYSLHSLGIS